MFKKLLSAFAVTNPAIIPPEERLFDGVTKPSVILADMCIQRMIMHPDKIDCSYPSLDVLFTDLYCQDVEASFSDPEKPLKIIFAFKTRNTHSNIALHVTCFQINMNRVIFSIPEEELPRLLTPLLNVAKFKLARDKSNKLARSQQKAIDIIEALIGPKEKVCETNSSSGDTPVPPKSLSALVDTTTLNDCSLSIIPTTSEKNTGDTSSRRKSTTSRSKTSKAV